MSFVELGASFYPPYEPSLVASREVSGRLA